LYAQALLATGRCVDCEPLLWQMFEQNPARMHQVVSLIGKMIDSELDAEAVALARKLEAFQRRRGERRSFITTMQELLASHRRAAEMDPYEPGQQKRLESLRGKIDDQRFNVIASRFTTVKKEEQEVKVQEPTLGAA